MNKLLLLLSIIFSVSLISCEKTENEIIYTPGGRVAYPEELSAGNSTVFVTSSTAYDTPANWVTNDLASWFLEGDALYDNPRVSDGNLVNGGLGPVYAGYSCASCHNDAGRTVSTLFTDGGTGKYGFSSFLTFMRTPNGQYHREYGRVLHDQAVYGSEPEGKLRVNYTEQNYTFPDGETYSLITPHYEIYDWYADSIPAEQLEISVRTPLRHVGMGLMLAIDKNEIKQLASIQYPEYGISGEINWVTERNVKSIGLSGHKAQHSDLTVELGFLSDMGVTNSRFPHEVSEGQSQVDGDYDIQITTEDMAAVDFYLHSLGVPARRAVTNATVIAGKELFYKAKCHLCHTPTLHTQPEGVNLLDGTHIPWLGGQTIHPYSDYLLHDMGPELGDDFSQFNASGDEWRTTPLWGVGLQEVVNGHSHFLHDGRARDFTEAIMWHGGEGDVSRQAFANMSSEERETLIMFLRSL
ncbi:di-heme oxidoredictase family protein [Plebeiibacterium sediminum]|uniref:Thiol oxidoreductase n=1 Tax=Plebeiibacterium sediminum TaxID=2992112 RepID=A0AAE3M144_9BACT|nr:di-heme oxidoredictase family protein [Plebeiobacterium sediminum]MCW3785324.1 thiol oxidoreductase [Plebeiobacterium sediminum]